MTGYPTRMGVPPHWLRPSPCMPVDELGLGGGLAGIEESGEQHVSAEEDRAETDVPTGAAVPSGQQRRSVAGDGGSEQAPSGGAEMEDGVQRDSYALLMSGRQKPTRSDR